MKQQKHIGEAKAMADTGADCYILDFGILRYLKYVAGRTNKTAWARASSAYYQLRDPKLKLLKQENFPAFIAQWKLGRAMKEFEVVKTKPIEVSVYGPKMKVNLVCFLRKQTCRQASIRRFVDAVNLIGGK